MSFVGFRYLLAHALLLAFCANSSFAAPTNNTILPENQLDEAVTFTLFATDFTDCDSTSACDLYVVINCRSSSSDWQSCGQTSKQQDDNNPVWPEVFTLNHVAGTSQRWRFDLVDVDVAFDDTIGSVEINTDEYVNAPGNLYQVPVPGNSGILWIHRRR